MKMPNKLASERRDSIMWFVNERVLVLHIWQMAWLHMRTAITTGLCVALLGTLSTGCSEAFNESTIEADQVCLLSNSAYAKQDFDGLLSALEKQFGVARNKMRITGQGIFIPMKESFVEEQGYFIARPGVSISGKGADPAFHRVKNCVYKYRIKG